MARKKPQAWRPIQDLCEGGNLGSGEEPSPEIQTMENKGIAQAKRNRSIPEERAALPASFFFTPTCGGGAQTCRGRKALWLVKNWWQECGRNQGSDSDSCLRNSHHNGFHLGACPGPHTVLSVFSNPHKTP